MIYLTGDCHADFRRFGKKQRMKLPHFIQPEDYVIVTETSDYYGERIENLSII